MRWRSKEADKQQTYAKHSLTEVLEIGTTGESGKIFGPTMKLLLVC